MTGAPCLCLRLLATPFQEHILKELSPHKQCWVQGLDVRGSWVPGGEPQAEGSNDVLDLGNWVDIAVPRNGPWVMPLCVK